MRLKMGGVNVSFTNVSVKRGRAEQGSNRRAGPARAELPKKVKRAREVGQEEVEVVPRSRRQAR